MKKVKVVFNRYQGDRAYFVTLEKEKVVLPARLVSDLKVGDSFVITFKDEEEAKASDEQLAKVILNEILNQG